MDFYDVFGFWCFIASYAVIVIVTIGLFICEGVKVNEYKFSGKRAGEGRVMKKDIPSLTLYVVFSITALIIYTIVEQVLSTVTGISHDTLTTCFYACFGGEILCCALIKIFKLKEENHE